MELHEATLQDLQRENPQLIKDLTESVRKGLKESKEAQAKENELKEANAKLAEFEKKEALAKQKTIITESLKDKDMPAAAKARIVESLSSEVFETEAKLKEAIEAKAKTELEYINQFSGKGKIKTGAENSSNNDSITESLQKELDTQAGIKEEKENEE